MSLFIRFESVPAKILVGFKAEMSLATYNPVPLWQRFMPLQRDLTDKVGDLMSLQIYPENYDGNPQTIFEKWVCIEVSSAQNLPETLEILDFPAGDYAVFLHRGTSADFMQTMQYIHQIWLPNSGFSVDDRPHFELLGAKYIRNHPDSEEEVWLPIKPIE
jgi:AraC family transcriptional regulator